MEELLLKAGSTGLKGLWENDFWKKSINKVVKKNSLVNGQIETLEQINE